MRKEDFNSSGYILNIFIIIYIIIIFIYIIINIITLLYYY